MGRRGKGEVNTGTTGTNHLGFRCMKSPESNDKRLQWANFPLDARGEALICVDFEMQIFNSLTNMIKNKYNYYICGLLVALACFTFLGCQTTTTGPSGSVAHLTVQRGPKFGDRNVLAVMVDGARVASVVTGSILQWHLVPGAACHICERKWPATFCLADKDCYGRSGADLQLHCDVAGEALSPAIIRHPKR